MKYKCKKIVGNQNEAYLSVMKTLFPNQQTWDRSKHMLRDERCFHERKLINFAMSVKYAYKARAFGILLAEIRVHKPCWCLDLLISWCMAHV